MLRFLAGVACCFLLMTGAFLIWQSRAAHAPGVTAGTPTGSVATSLFGGTGEILQAPEADEKTKAQKRFSRYDKNKDGKVEQDEYLAARRRNFDKLDVDHNGVLSFAEYAAKAIEKFDAAGGRKGWLTEAEFATTAPKRSNKHRATCSCRAREHAPEPPQIASEDNNDN